MCVGKNNFVDTPGLGDSGGKDSEHLAECEKLGSVNAMVLVLNSTLPRIDEPIRDALSLFNTMFPNLFRSLIVVFSKWRKDPASVESRGKEGVTADTKSKEIQSDAADIVGDVGRAVFLFFLL